MCDVITKVNKEILKFLDNDMKCSHILAGRKEIEELRETQEEPDNPEVKEAINNGASTILVDIIEVDKDSYLAGAYVMNGEELGDLSYLTVK